MSYEQMQEEENFTHTTDAEWDREEARSIGEAHPDRAWVLTGRDVWHQNQYYTGPREALLRHPDDEGESDEQHQSRMKWIEGGGNVGDHGGNDEQPF